MSSKNPKYTQEYKQTIVNLYHSGKTYSEIHKEYGISHSPLSTRSSTCWSIISRTISFVFS